MFSHKKSNQNVLPTRKLSGAITDIPTCLVGGKKKTYVSVFLLLGIVQDMVFFCEKISGSDHTNTTLFFFFTQTTTTTQHEISAATGFLLGL